MDGPRQSQNRRLSISAERAGERLDRAVGRWRGQSRSAVLRLLDAGGLIHNGRAVLRKDKGLVLREGDVIEIDAQFGDEEAPLPDRETRLELLAKGEGWLVVNKPAGLAVRPHALDETGTVINAVAAKYPSIIGVGEGGLRSGVVHRLDNETSGTLLVATEEQAWQRLRQAFAEHLVRKRYLALLHGGVPDSGQSAERLRVARHSPAYVQVCESDASESGALDSGALDSGVRACSLAWHVIERFGDKAALVEVDLHTGFLHQIRVMMSHLGHPVIGDTQYGGDHPAMQAGRQMLHASSLAFEEILVQAPLPDDFQRVMTALRNR